MAEDYQSIYEGERMDELWTLADTALQKVRMNGVLRPVSGRIADLGTVLTEHQSLAGLQPLIDASHKLAYSLISGTPDLSVYRTATAQDAIDDAIRGRLTTIEALIPSAATASNKLADMAFVNSSIATATATFRGTSATGLTEAQFLAWANGLTKDNNDYVFWNTTDSAGNPQFKRYKYNGSSWGYEYTLNNSSFTAAQWATINSGLTSTDKTKLDAALALIDTFGDIVTHDASEFATATALTQAVTDLTTNISSALQTAKGYTDDALTPVGVCLQSLQSQIDSVAARTDFDELTTSALFADILTAPNIYGNLHGDADNALLLGGHAASYFATVTNLAYEVTLLNSTIGEAFRTAEAYTDAVTADMATHTWVQGQGYLTGITSQMVTTALGYTPYNAADIEDASVAYAANAGKLDNHAASYFATATALSQAVTDLTTNISGALQTAKDYTDTAEGNIHTWVEAKRYLTAITKAMVEGVLTGNIATHTHSQYLTAITTEMVINVLGYTPYSASNPDGFISGITKEMVDATLPDAATLGGHSASYFATQGAFEEAVEYLEEGLAYHTHALSALTDDANHRLVTDTQITAWKNKWDYNENTIKAVKVNNAGHADSADTAGSVAWANVTGHPTKLSEFTNDSGFVTSSGSVAYATSAGSADYATSAGNATKFDGQTSAYYAKQGAMEQMESYLLQGISGAEQNAKAYTDASLLPVSTCLQSLQSQIDSVASRDSFDELLVATLFVDTLTATNIYGTVSNATNADTLDGYHASYFQPLASAINTGNIGSQSVAYAANAGKVNNHTVNTDVPAGAVFTDTHDTNVEGTGISVSGTRGSIIAISAEYQTYISNGNTAYGWGNHANAGYAMATALTQAVSDLTTNISAALQTAEGYTDTSLTPVGVCLQALQSQIDSVASKTDYDELLAATIYADTISAGNIYGTLHGNADTATTATNATNATNASNAANLGGIAASSYLTVSSGYSYFAKVMCRELTRNTNFDIDVNLPEIQDIVAGINCGIGSQVHYIVKNNGGSVITATINISGVTMADGQTSFQIQPNTYAEFNFIRTSPETGAGAKIFGRGIVTS